LSARMACQMLKMTKLPCGIVADVTGMCVTPGSVVGPCRGWRGLAGERQRAHGQSDDVKPWAEERSSIDHSLSSLTPPVPIGPRKHHSPTSAGRMHVRLWREHGLMWQCKNNFEEISRKFRGDETRPAPLPPQP